MKSLDIQKIRELLPERYPLLLVDRILDLEPGVRAVGTKNVTINEEFFLGHFTEHPVMPGVLILEAMAQVGRILLHASHDPPPSGGWRIARIEGARFRRPVGPGDCLRLEVELAGQTDSAWTLRGRAFVEEVLVAEASLSAHLCEEAR